MQLEVGRRYRLIRYDGLADCDGTLEADEHGALLFRPDCTDYSFMVEANGAAFGIGALREIAPAPSPLRPVFGHDATEFARLRQRFETWDFRWGT